MLRDLSRGFSRSVPPSRRLGGCEASRRSSHRLIYNSAAQTAGTALETDLPDGARSPLCIAAGITSQSDQHQTEISDFILVLPRHAGRPPRCPVRALSPINDLTTSTFLYLFFISKPPFWWEYFSIGTNDRSSYAHNPNYFLSQTEKTFCLLKKILFPILRNPLCPNL